MAALLIAAVAAALWTASVVQALCPHACSGHGVCDRYIVCHCHEGFTGYDCSGIACPRGRAWGVVTATDRAHELAECSGRGLCDAASGACHCQQGFFGDACQFVDCPDACMGFGKCVSMREHAQNERVSRELYDAFSFRYDDVWDADMILGCECDETYAGPNCALKRCPVGDDPLTTGQTDELQLIECVSSYQQQTLTLRADAALTKGTFILAFGKQYTEPIAFNALATVDSSGVSVASALLALTGVTAATVTRTSPSLAQTDWQLTFPAANTVQNAVVPRWKVLEVQQFVCAADAGVFSLTFNNDTVSKIPFNADVNTFLTLITAKIPTIGALDVSLAPAGTTTVCSTAGTYVTVRFTELLHRDFYGDIPALTFAKLDAKGLVALTLGVSDGFVDDEAKEVVKGVDTCRVIEQQAFECAATSGNFALTFEDGTRVANVPFDISSDRLRATILAAVAYIVDLDVVFSAGSAVACSAAGTTTTLSFVVARSTGPRGDGDLAPVLADRTNGGVDGLSHISNRLKFPTTVLTEVVRGVTCVPLDQTFSTDPANQIVAPVVSGGGSFTVSFRDDTSLPIAAHSTPEIVKRTLERLPSIQGVDVSFTGAQACETPANVMQITFTQNFGKYVTAVTGWMCLCLCVSRELTADCKPVAQLADRHSGRCAVDAGLCDRSVRWWPQYPIRGVCRRHERERCVLWPRPVRGREAWQVRLLPWVREQQWTRRSRDCGREPRRLRLDVPDPRVVSRRALVQRPRSVCRRPELEVRVLRRVARRRLRRPRVSVRHCVVRLPDGRERRASCAERV